MSTNLAFEERFLAFKEVEVNKNQLIEVCQNSSSFFSFLLRSQLLNWFLVSQDLLLRVKQLEATLTEEKLHLEREQEATKSFQLKLHDALLVTKRNELEMVR